MKKGMHASKCWNCLCCLFYRSIASFFSCAVGISSVTPWMGAWQLLCQPLWECEFLPLLLVHWNYLPFWVCGPGEAQAHSYALCSLLPLTWCATCSIRGHLHAQKAPALGSYVEKTTCPDAVLPWCVILCTPDVAVHTVHRSTTELAQHVIQHSCSQCTD